MPKKVAVKRDYSRLIAQFASEGSRQLEKINQKHQAYAEEIIRFAVLVKSWNDQALEEDEGEEGDCYKAVGAWFKDWAAENIGDKYQLYHWNKIASAATVLSSPKILPHLPHTKMALVHLAKKTKGDKSGDIERFTNWIAKGQLSSETTVSEAKKLGVKVPKQANPSEGKTSRLVADAKRTTTAFRKNGVVLDVPLSSVSRQFPDRDLFTRGLTVAILGSETDEASGVEKLVLLTVVNSETALADVLDSLKD
jgi:hypothetical protein